MLNCDRAFWLRVVKGYNPERPNIALQLGNAVHFVLEHVVRRQLNDRAQWAYLAAEACAKYGVSHMMAAVLTASTTALGRLSSSTILYRGDGTPLVEVKFSEAYDEDTLVEGTIDRIDIAGGRLRILDYKTTSRKGLTDIGNEYLMKSQLRFYRWFLKKYGQHYLPAEYYEMFCAGQYFTQYLMISMNSQDCEFSAALGPNDLDIADSADMIRWQIDKAKAISLYPDLPPPTGRFTDACKHCDFNHICQAQAFGDRVAAIHRMQQSPYNPLQFRE